MKQDLYDTLKQSLEEKHQRELAELSEAFARNGKISIEPGKTSFKNSKGTRRSWRGPMERGEVKKSVLQVANLLSPGFSTYQVMQKMKEVNPSVYRRMKKHGSTSACLSAFVREGKLTRTITSSGDSEWSVAT